MIYKNLIIIKSGLLLIVSLVLFGVLIFGMAGQVVDLGHFSVWDSQRSTVHVAHHNSRYQSTRAQPALANTPVLTEHVTIRPLTDIFVDGPPEIVNITTTYATLLFTSSVPVICSVVYGPADPNTDNRFGLIAQDSTMNGGAIVDHRPLLAGLLPGTDYEYRVQGTDANGIIYVGENGTFTTPAEPTQPASETNVADLNDGAEVLAVSSNFGGAANDQSWGANSAIDGNPSTAWSSSGDGDDAFIEIGLTETSIVTAIDVWTRFMTDGSARISQFTVTTDPGSANSETFGPFTLPDAAMGYRFEIEGTAAADSIRLDVVESSGGNTGLVEFKVFATATVTATTTNSLELFFPLTAQ